MNLMRLMPKHPKTENNQQKWSKSSENMSNSFKNKWQQNLIKSKVQRMNLINPDKLKSNLIRMKFRDCCERSSNFRMKLKVYENGESIKTKKLNSWRIKFMSWIKITSVLRQSLNQARIKSLGLQSHQLFKQSQRSWSNFEEKMSFLRIKFMMIKRLRNFMNSTKKFSTLFSQEDRIMRKDFKRTMLKSFNKCSQINTLKIESTVLNKRIEKWRF